MPGKGKPFKKGDPRINRNGREMEPWTWAGTVRRMAEEGKKGDQLKEAVSRSLIKEAIKGNVPAIKEFGDRIDGKAPQSTDITTDGEKIKGIQINIVDDSEL